MKIEEIRRQLHEDVRRRLERLVLLRLLTADEADEVARAIAGSTLSWAMGEMSEEQVATGLCRLADSHTRAHRWRNRATN